MTNQEQYEIMCDKAQKYDKMIEVLEKIKSEVREYQSDFDKYGTEYDRTAWCAYNRCLKIIDKYRETGE